MSPMLEACAAMCAAVGAPAAPAPAIVITTPLAADVSAGPIVPVRHYVVPAARSAMLDDDELAELRGGQSIVVTNQTMVAVTAGNVLNGDYAAGAVTLSDSALQGFNGVGNLLINTGAQVSLQTGMNLTINLNQ